MNNRFNSHGNTVQRKKIAILSHKPLPFHSLSSTVGPSSALRWRRHLRLVADISYLLSTTGSGEAIEYKSCEVI